MFPPSFLPPVRAQTTLRPVLTVFDTNELKVAVAMQMKFIVFSNYFKQSLSLNIMLITTTDALETASSMFSILRSPQRTLEENI